MNKCMKSLTPKQAKILIAYIITTDQISESVAKIIAQNIYKIVKSTDHYCKPAWKKYAVSLFKSHKLK